MPSPLLVFDTATEHLAVALVHARGVETADESGGARASQRLLPLVAELLDRAGVERAALAAIGFGRGPGAFTGLRTACSVAQGLAMALQRPLVPVDTLAAVAEDAWQRSTTGTGRRVEAPARWWVLQDARMGELYAACWRRTEPGAWACERKPMLLRPAEWSAIRDADPRPFGAAGSALGAFGDALGLARHPCEPQARASAAALAVLVRHGWVAGATVAPEAAYPLYVRDKVAQTTAERAASRDARPLDPASPHAA